MVKRTRTILSNVAKEIIYNIQTGYNIQKTPRQKIRQINLIFVKIRSLLFKRSGREQKSICTLYMKEIEKKIEWRKRRDKDRWINIERYRKRSERNIYIQCAFFMRTFLKAILPHL